MVDHGGVGMQFKPEQVYTFVAFVSSVLGMWSILSAKMTKQENRITVLEKDIENLKEFKESANHRLDSHDKQNEVLIRLTTEITNLSEKVEKIDSKLEELS